MRAIVIAFGLVALTTLPAQAADQAPAGTVLPPSASSPAPAATPSQTKLTAAQLDQLVAPIALYPDELLADVLMASTYPIEIVEADRWEQQNKKLDALALTQALDQQSWHQSVKSLVATPTVLEMMNDQIGWTQQLGNAVLAQQADVMVAVQRLRAKAKAANALHSTKEQTVSVQQQGGNEIIIIEPATPGVVYVPYYNPAVVYGGWAYPAYPPYYLPPPAGYALATGIAFGVGFAIGDAAWHGYWGGYWGGFDWGHGNINVHNTVKINNDVHVNVNNWQHDVNDRTDNFKNTFRGDSSAFSNVSRNVSRSDLNIGGDKNVIGGDKNVIGTARDNNVIGTARDNPALGDRAQSTFGNQRFDGHLGDAFGSPGGYRSDFRGGGFRGGDWGGGGRFGGGGFRR